MSSPGRVQEKKGSMMVQYIPVLFVPGGGIGLVTKPWDGTLLVNPNRAEEEESWLRGLIPTGGTGTRG